MDAADFEFDTEALPALSNPQQTVLEEIAEMIRRLGPADLDARAVEARFEGDALVVVLPHRRDEQQNLVVSITDSEAVVSFPYEHEHFYPDDPVKGKVWPVEAPDFALAAARFVEQLLLGRVELEVREGFLSQRVRCYLLDERGDRELFARGGTLWPKLRPEPAKTVRIDFGLPPDA